METKEVIGILSELQDAAEYYINERDKQALQTAISHLETLQKVKEMGGAQKKKVSCLNMSEGEANFNAGFNQAIDLKDAELAGRLEKLEQIITNWGKSIVVDEGLIDDLALAIREAILKKER